MIFLYRERSGRAGFTLVEAVVSAGILAVVATAVGLFARDVFSLNTSLTGALSTHSGATRAFRPFLADLRSAQPSEAGAFPIAESSTSSLAIYSDVDHDGAVERVRYFVEGGALRRAVSEPSGSPAVYGPAATSTLVEGVLASSTVFVYYPHGYDGTASTSPLAFPVSPADVRAARVWLSVDADPARAPGPVTMTVAATIRNLRGSSLDSN